MRETAKRKTTSVEEPPLDNDALRASLMRKLADTLGRARRCPERACRRKRGCASPRFTCMELADRRAHPRASDHQAASLAMLKRMLNERLGQGGEPGK